MKILTQKQLSSIEITSIYLGLIELNEFPGSVTLIKIALDTGEKI